MTHTHPHVGAGWGGVGVVGGVWWAGVPICSFSKGSSTSFRLASRRMSVQIYGQTEERNDVNGHKRAEVLFLSPASPPPTCPLPFSCLTL